MEVGIPFESWLWCPGEWKGFKLQRCSTNWRWCRPVSSHLVPLVPVQDLPVQSAIQLFMAQVMGFPPLLLEAIPQPDASQHWKHFPISSLNLSLLNLIAFIRGSQTVPHPPLCLLPYAPTVGQTPSWCNSAGVTVVNEVALAYCVSNLLALTKFLRLFADKPWCLSCKWLVFPP